MYGKNIMITYLAYSSGDKKSLIHKIFIFGFGILLLIGCKSESSGPPPGPFEIRVEKISLMGCASLAQGGLCNGLSGEITLLNKGLGKACVPKFYKEQEIVDAFIISSLDNKIIYEPAIVGRKSEIFPALSSFESLRSKDSLKIGSKSSKELKFTDQSRYILDGRQSYKYRFRFVYFPCDGTGSARHDEVEGLIHKAL